jgi:hypothetical protein
MRPDLDRILKAILDDVLSEIHNILKSEVGINLKVGKNTLAGSDLDKNISGKITSEGLDVEFPHYIVYVEWDRPERYKNPPPYSVILDWIKRKGIQPTAGNIKTVEQLAWVFRYVIWRDGYTKRLIAGLNREYDYMKSPLDEYIDKMWKEKWAEELFNIIMNEINRYFE